MFYLDVAKVDLDVAYTYMLQVYVASVFRCFICMFTSVLSRCCIRLQWFLNVFQVFSQLFQTFVSSVSFIFFCMIQLLYLDVSKVDRVLYMGCTWKVAGGADDVRGSAGPLLLRSLASPTRYTLVCSLCAAASGR